MTCVTYNERKSVEKQYLIVLKKRKENIFMNFNDSFRKKLCSWSGHHLWLITYIKLTDTGSVFFSHCKTQLIVDSWLYCLCFVLCSTCNRPSFSFCLVFPCFCQVLLPLVIYATCNFIGLNHMLVYVTWILIDWNHLVSLCKLDLSSFRSAV